MAATWILVRVDLLEGLGGALAAPPGRVFLVGPSHTFAHLADAIDAAFGRWDLSHMHEFGLPDGRMVGIPDDDAPAGQLDESEVKVASAVAPGEAFAYAFDLGDEWRHACVVLDEKVDPAELSGARPRRPVPIDGWGWIPDQYGREAFDPDP